MSRGFQPSAWEVATCPRGAPRWAKSRRLDNSSAWRTRGRWEFLATMAISIPQTPTSLLSIQITGSVAGRWGRGARKRPRLRVWRLAWPPGDSSIQPGLSYLREMEPQSGSCCPFQHSLRLPPSHRQVPLGASRCVPPSTGWLPISRRTGWV